MHTETLAVAAVMREISRTQRLVPFLNAHDKEPVWDGYVAVYRTGAPYRNDDLLRRIPVQIKADKGKTDATELQYPVRRVDLRLYQTDNPTVFFVVRWDETGETVYCAAFTQEEAAALFPDRDAETEVSVRFTPFPNTNTEKERLFLKLASGDAEDILAEPVERRPLSDTDIFRYNAGLVDFYGREAEREALDAFLNAKPESALCADFLWWGVIGPGGAGKTRLGYEWANRVPLDWTVHFLEAGDYKDLNAVTARYSGKLLLIADYARQHIEALGEYMEGLCQSKRKSPVRLLLLERDEGKDKAGEIQWERELYTPGRMRYLTAARYRKLLALQRLTDEPMICLIRSFAAALKERDATLPELTENEAGKLVEGLPGIDKESRPLFAMILTDAFLHDPTAHWTQKSLLDRIVMREEEQTEKAVASFQASGEKYDRQLANAALRLRRLATALGSSGDRTVDELLALDPKLKKTFDDRAEYYRHYVESLEELLLYLGLLRFQEGNALVPALRPDLLGEYALLHWLTDGSTRPQERAAFYAAALGDWELRAFYQRLYADYAPLLNGRPERWESLLPADLPVEGYAASRYTHLLYDGFTRCTDRTQRQRLVSETAHYADAVQEETPAAGNIFNNLGLLYHNMGDYSHALEYYQKALAIDEKALGPEHPSTATSYNNLGTVYRDMGDYSRALEYFQKDLAIEKQLGEERPNTAVSYNNLGSVYKAMGDWPRALEYHRKALAIREKTLGPEHPSTATSYHNLGELYRAMGDYPRALEYHRKALAIYEKTLGPEHPDTAASYNNLGTVYDDMGDWPRALDFHQKALAIDEKALGPEHPDTATDYNNLGTVYHDMGDWPRALEYHQKALAIHEKTLGPEHPDTAASYNNLGGVYMAMGDFPHALAYSEKAAAIAEAVLGPELPDTKLYKKNLNFLKLLAASADADGGALPSK